MILKALYDYYHRCEDLSAPGMEEKEIGFIIVLSENGKFVRFEDSRSDDGKSGKTYLVKKHVGRTSAAVANYLYDNSDYVLGYSDCRTKLKELDAKLDEIINTHRKEEIEKQREECSKKIEKEPMYFGTFREKVDSIFEKYPDSPDLLAVFNFYSQGRDRIIEEISKDPLWEDITKNLSEKYSTFSFRIEGDTRIIAEKEEILQLDDDEGTGAENLCLVTGRHGKTVNITTETMIPGSQATAKLVSFQINSGYDSYGKTKCGNAPISKEAEFAYSTALKKMLEKNSRNKFSIGKRTFLFWASSKSEAAEQAEESLLDLFGYSSANDDDPNSKIEHVRRVFKSIYSGTLRTELNDQFHILGLAPNSARIAIVYWSETSLKDFAGKILEHFSDMEIVDGRKEKKPYMGVYDIISAVTIGGGKQSEVMPNLPEAVVKSIFQGFPYPYTLFTACLNRLKAESGEKAGARKGRIAILKAYLNRITDISNKKIEIMLDKSNSNQGYLCGRLFAVLDRIQETANGISSIRERYMNAASSTPAAVFATILNLSSHHLENLETCKRIFYEKVTEEIIGKISAEGFPTHLDLQDQGRFFVGYYHQRQEFFNKKDTSEDQCDTI